MATRPSFYGYLPTNRSANDIGYASKKLSTIQLATHSVVGE